MRAPLHQESINDTAKLIMHRLIAPALARDPTLIDRARIALSAASKMFAGRTVVSEWEELLRLPVHRLGSLLVSRAQRMKRYIGHLARPSAPSPQHRG